MASWSRASASGGRSATGSAGYGPTWCSATTRGSGTACTPTTATPACWRSRGSSPPATRTSSGSRAPTPHRPSALLLWEADEPDHVEDVTAFLDVKVAALLEHRSQYRSTMDITDPSSESETEAFRARVREKAVEHGRDAGFRYGERFKLITKL